VALDQQAAVRRLDGRGGLEDPGELLLAYHIDDETSAVPNAPMEIVEHAQVIGGSSK